MKHVITIVTLGALVLSGQLCAQAQDAAYGPAGSRMLQLHGRHAITLSVGYMANTGDVASVTTHTRFAIGGSSYAVGWIGYGHWFDEAWALQVETGWMAAYWDVTAGLGEASTEASAVVPLLFGVRYQPRLSERSTVRPFLAALAGPYFGLSSRTGTGPFLWEGGTRGTAGMRLGAGLDVLAGSWFKIGTELRYHALGDFDWQDGARENYSGVEFAVGFGILLGGRD